MVSVIVVMMTHVRESLAKHSQNGSSTARSRGTGTQRESGFRQEQSAFSGNLSPAAEG